MTRGAFFKTASRVFWLACAGCSGIPSVPDQPIDANGGGGATGGAAMGGSTASESTAATGGALITGGASATGGVATGGATTDASGGVVAVGGAIATGGVLSTGGTASTGGAVSTGGTASTGGVVATGGAIATGGQFSSGGNSETAGAGGKTDIGTVATGGWVASGGSANDAGDECPAQGATITVTGTLHNNSSSSGRVYLRMHYTDGSTSLAGTSLLVHAGDTLPFEIRLGAQNSGLFILDAVLDVTGTGMPSRVEPSASQTIELMGADLPSVQLNLNLPTLATPPAPSVGVASTTSNGVVVSVQHVVDVARIDYAEFYRVYYTSDLAGGVPGPTHHEGMVTYPLNASAAYISGLTQGKDYQVAATAVAGGSEGPVSLPRTVTVGSASTGFQVSGTVSLSGISTTAKSKLLTVLYSPSSGINVGVSDATSATAYTIKGLAANTYRQMAFLDLDGDGLFTMVEPHQGHDSATLMAVHADASGANYSLLPTSVVARVSTSYSPNASSYDLSLNVTPNLSLPARVILCSGPNVPTPSEIGIQADGDLRFGGWVSLPPGAVPVDGDAYRFKVILSDGTVQIYDAKIAGILAAGITLVSPQGNVQSTTPTFTWTTTGTLPEVYAQDLYVYSSNTSQWELSQLDPSVRSVKYNSEGSASPSALALNTGYFWHVRIQDSQGNTIESDDAAFTPVP